MTLVKKRLQHTKLAMLYHKRMIALILTSILLGISFLAFCTDGSWREAEGMIKNVMKQIDDICTMEKVTEVAELVAVIYDDGASSLTIGGRTIHNIGLLTSISDIFTGISFCFIVLTFFMSFMNVREQEITSEEPILEELTEEQQSDFSKLIALIQAENRQREQVEEYNKKKSEIAKQNVEVLEKTLRKDIENFEKKNNKDIISEDEVERRKKQALAAMEKEQFSNKRKGFFRKVKRGNDVR